MVSRCSTSTAPPRSWSPTASTRMNRRAFRYPAEWTGGLLGGWRTAWRQSDCADEGVALLREWRRIGWPWSHVTAHVTAHVTVHVTSHAPLLGCSACSPGAGLRGHLRRTLFRLLRSLLPGSQHLSACRQVCRPLRSRHASCRQAAQARALSAPSVGSASRQHDSMHERLLRGLQVLPLASGPLLFAKAALPRGYAMVSSLRSDQKDQPAPQQPPRAFERVKAASRLQMPAAFFTRVVRLFWRGMKCSTTRIVHERTPLSQSSGFCTRSPPSPAQASNAAISAVQPLISSTPPIPPGAFRSVFFSTFPSFDPTSLAGARMMSSTSAGVRCCAALSSTLETEVASSAPVASRCRWAHTRMIGR